MTLTIRKPHTVVVTESVSSVTMIPKAAAAVRHSHWRTRVVGVMVTAMLVVILGSNTWRSNDTNARHNEQRYDAPPHMHRREAGARPLHVPTAKQNHLGLSADSLDAILTGRVHLVELTVQRSELQRHVSALLPTHGRTAKTPRAGDPDPTTLAPYHGIYGTFCRLDWSLHKATPSSYPMFRDLLAASDECDESQRIRNVPLAALVRLVQTYDQTHHYQNVLNVTAVVFHESRCGSTLTANLLAAADPEAHRVYSESTPPIQALHQICGDDYSHCSMDTAVALFQHVIYLMSRTDDPRERRVFFKLQSAGTRNVQVFTKAFPTTPYLFVYRDPVQVIMSHLKHGPHKANCLRSRHFPPASVERVAAHYGGTGNANANANPRDTRRTRLRSKNASGARRLNAEEYCAAHLAAITESILPVLMPPSSWGRAVAYTDVPQDYYTDIFPQLLGVEALSSTQLTRLYQVAAQYSKNRGGKRVTGDFASDSEQKDRLASDKVRQAAATYLQPSYLQLQALSQQAPQRRRRET